jgi:hypothetical protein
MASDFTRLMSAGDVRRADQAADRRDDDENAVLPLRHFRPDHVHQPEIRHHVVLHDLEEHFLLQAGERAEVGI